MTDNSYDDEAELRKYIGRWYNHLFTDEERSGPTARRLRALVPEASASDINATIDEWLGGKAESGPAVRRILATVDDLTRMAIDRIRREHSADLLINRCPSCQRIVASPTAKQCLWCGKDWHSMSKNK